ncbi:hypothetical protein SPSIL_052070 [Sporomusa silvacetica DSM 10669]|uniref:Uncharacterized protein n=1 Tax=Sporomusa silvacetica DSM 10669 TaxID=1123289 RepID=A0ABZ3ITE0_9FIRM
MGSECKFWRKVCKPSSFECNNLFVAFLRVRFFYFSARMEHLNNFKGDDLRIFPIENSQLFIIPRSVRLKDINRSV